MKLITRPWFTGGFKAGGRQWQNHALQSGRLPTAQAQLSSCFQNGYSRFMAFLVFGFVFLSQDLTDPRLNSSSLCGQRWPWTSYPPAFSLWALNIVWYSWGNFFSSDMGEGKIHRIYNYHQRNNAKWWFPSNQCLLRITPNAMQWARTQTVSWLPNTVQVAGQRDIEDVSLSLLLNAKTKWAQINERLSSPGLKSVSQRLVGGCTTLTCWYCPYRFAVMYFGEIVYLSGLILISVK